MQNFKIKFIVEREWECDIQANSAEEAYELFCEGRHRAPMPTGWSEMQADSIEVEEITDDN
jgi:hypothetical protein